MADPRIGKNNWKGRTYYNIMLGNKKLVYLGTIEKIAEKFGVNLKELVAKQVLTPTSDTNQDNDFVLKEIQLKEVMDNESSYNTN